MPARSQRGLAAAAVIITVIIVAVVLLLGRRFFGAELTLDQRATTDANLRRVSEALIQFALLNQRLPCPASGTSSDGAEDPPGPVQNCNSRNGVVPWSVLNLKPSDALDGFGRRISYRVFDGTKGLTQTGGASMTDCNTNAGAQDGVDLVSGKCKSSRVSRSSAFFDGKGLSLQGDSGSPSTGFAFALISHGESGAGAFTAEGGGRLPLPASSALEFRNTQAASTIDNRTRSAPGIATTDNAHFDDIVLARSISDIVNGAKLTARDWGSPSSVAGEALDTATVTAVITASGGAVDYNTGQSSLDFGTFRVTAYGDSARSVGFDVGAGSGIGSIGSGANSSQYVTLNRETNEGLTFVFDSPGRYLGITLARFGDQSGERERVSFDFVIGGSSVRITKMACRGGNGRVNFTVTPGGDFAEVSIEPRLTQFFNYYSNFVIASIALCPSANPSCTAPGSIPSEDCP